MPLITVPASVTGHAGPRTKTVTPTPMRLTAMIIAVRRPTRSIARTPNTPLISRPMPNVLPCRAATTPDRRNCSRSSPRTTPMLRAQTSTA